jgi:phage terminase large subunit-like protein
VTDGKAGEDIYLLADDTIQGSPLTWAKAAVTAYYRHKANCIVAEKNNGGEMVALTIATVDDQVPVKLVSATRGKQTRAEPIAALYEKGHGHHVGSFPALEDELCLWIPGDPSPNRLDAHVWASAALKSDLAIGDWSSVKDLGTVEGFRSPWR